MIGSLFRALDAAAVINICIMLFLYVPILLQRDPSGSTDDARNLVRGIVTAWIGSLILFGNLVYKYWMGLADPLQSLADPIIRLFYINLILIGTTMHIATALRGQFSGWWKTFSVWSAGAFVCIGILFLADMHILPRIFDPWPPLNPTAALKRCDSQCRPILDNPSP
jgi:hypothetical protein